MERWPADPEHIALAVERLRQSAIIAFPTDTLYAVAARAGDPSAVKRLYAVKGRPETQPFVLLVAGSDEVHEWAIVTSAAERLMKRFWPGALTLVLPTPTHAPTMGPPGGTMAFRSPDHPVALELLRRLREPLASSSANKAGAPPPSDAEAVLRGLEPELDLVLDGGRTPLGQASTILDLSASRPRVLRQGIIAEDQLLGQS